MRAVFTFSSVLARRRLIKSRAALPMRPLLQRTAPEVSNPFDLDFRNYSPFRGKDSDQRLRDHLARLPHEIEKELEQMNAYITKRNRDFDLEKMAWATVETRQDWDDKFTTEETDFIDNVVSREAFDKLVGVVVSGNESDQESKLAASFVCLESLKEMIPKLSSFVGANGGNMKEVLKKSAERITQYQPPVEPCIGFPSNQEVMERHTKLISFLKHNSDYKVGVTFPSTLKSPFGPVSSSACFEELSELQAVHLNHLRTSVVGVVPHSKILLTVRHTTVVLPSKTVTTVVEDDAGKCVLMQIYNIPNVQNTFGMKSMPVGARFYLKNPFLKVALDGWLTLRVDQPFDLVRLDVPPLHGSILIIGDGDFSFSVALAHKNQKLGNSFIVASSLDSRQTIVERYEKGERNIGALDKDPNVKVFHGLDASDLTPLGETQWDSIVWNFPYPVNGTGTIPAKICRELVSSFLDGMDKHLKPEGRLYLTLAPRQGGTTREAAGSILQWDVETAASEARMEVIDVVPFHHDEFPGYEPRRAYADKSFPYEGAKTHILGWKKEPKIGETPSERTIFSRMSSMLIDQNWGPSSAAIVKNDIGKQLEPYAHTSQTASTLLDAAKSFEGAKRVLDAQISEDVVELSSAIELLSLLAKVFRTPQGELVAEFTNAELEVVIWSCRIVLANYFGTAASQQLRSETQNSDSLKFIRAVQQLTVATGVNRSEDLNGVHFDDVLLLLAVAESMIDQQNSLCIVSIALSMAPDSIHLLHFCAAMKAIVMADKYKVSASPSSDVGNSSELMDIVKDCESALEKLNKSDPLYSSFVYLMAGMYLYLACSRGESSSARSRHVWLSISLFEEYISLVESVDRMLALAHYRLGLAYVFVESFDTQNTSSVPKSVSKEARSHYTKGLEAEKKRLPFFGPLSCQYKRLLSIAVMSKPFDNEKSQQNPGSKRNKSPMEDEETISNDVSGSSIDERNNCRKRRKGDNDEKMNKSPNHEEDQFFQDVRQLTQKHPDGVDLSLFRETYSREFRDRCLPLQSSEALKQLIGRAEAAGVCLLEERGGRAFWVRPPLDDERVFFGNVRQMMKRHPAGFDLARFREAYSQEFEGRRLPLQNNERLKQLISRAEKAGACQLEKLNACEFWVRAIVDDERTFFANVEQLMKKFHNGVYLGSFRNEYSREFVGLSIPLQSNQSLKQLVARAEKAGACRLEQRGETEYWVSPKVKN